MVALIEAMSLDGCVVEVSEGAEIAEPIEIVNIASGEGAYSLYSRIEIALGVGARASFVETFLGAGKAVQRHAATTLTLAKGARLKHVVVVDDAAELHLESQIIELDEKAELNAFALVSGGVLTRRQIFAKLVGEEAKVALGGLALLDGSRRADTTLQVVHSAPGGTSREFYRAIVDDEAIGIFQGKVIVANGAQKTDGAMKSQAILLSPQAQMNTKPELEIFADDVVCGHGATVGSLDPEQVFYLQARGIPKDDAEAMLLEAFGREAIDRVEDEMLAEALCALVARLACIQGSDRPPTRRRDDGDARVNDFVRTPLEPYDVAKIREDFPILTERPYGKPLVYLDNAASAQKPKAVIDRLVHAYEHEYANVHRGLHYLANAATEAYEAARESVRRFLNAASTEEIIFTRSATEAINLAAASYGLKNIGAGDEIVLERDGASLQHRALALPPRAQGRHPALGRSRRRRLVFYGGFRAGAERPDEDRRDHPNVERPGDCASGQGDDQARARARRPGARRRLSGRRSSRRRRP